MLKSPSKLSLWLKKYIPVLLFGSLCLGAGYSLGNNGFQLSFQGGSKLRPQLNLTRKEVPKDVNTKLDFGLLWKVISQLEKSFLDSNKLDGQKMVYGAIKGLVGSLGDPYTAFFTPEENANFKKDLDGVYEGIGAELGFREGQLVVVAALEGSPAQRAGVRSQDTLISVNGKNTAGWTLPEAVQNIQGQSGTEVTLTLSREQGQSFELKIKREQIKVPSVRLSWVGEHKDIAQIRVLRFGFDTIKEWDKLVDELSYQDKSGALKGVILDVRNNPGGFLDGAIHIGSDFFKDGVVVKRENNNAKVEEFPVDHACKLCSVKLVGLINKGSASASEIVTGAFKARERGKLVGEQSFGKGTVQEAIELDGGASIHVTTARWLLPNNDNIHGKGIAPDVLVTPTEEDLKSGKDPQLEKAIQLILES